MAIALFQEWPRLRTRLDKKPLIPQDRAGKYPLLELDLNAVETIIGPAFTEFDLKALRAQNSFRRQQVALICVTALTTAFGAVQAAFSHQLWPGVVVAVLGVLSAAVAGQGGERAAHRDYLEHRTRAERLRSAAFAYLAGLPPFGEDDREARLARAVTDIAEGREPA